ncbi:MAG: MFS transporter [Bacteroidales bacterium]|nr:MFS transporter [Bacteroidales bacterium]
MINKELKRSVLLIAAFAAFITPFMGSAVNLALPSIGNELDASAKQLNWVVSAYMLATAVFLLPFGRLGDIMGRKKIFVSGLVLFTIATTLVIFTQNIFSFLVLRVFQGMASAMIFGTSMAIITSVFPPGERGKAMGINITAVYAGLSSGPFLGGLLTEYFGWRSIFIFLIPLSAIAVFLTLSKVRTEWADARGEKLDIPGALLLGGGLILTIAGFSKIPGTTGMILIGSGLIFIALFFLYERKAKQPLLDINLLLSNRVFSFSNLAAMIHYASTAGIGFFLSLYLQYLKGMDARTAGFVIMTQPIMMALFSVPAGRLSDKWNPGNIASAGIATTAIGIFALTFLKQDSSLTYIIAVLAFIGLGYALFSSPNSNAIMSSVGKKHLGVASGMLGTMRMVGQTVSLGIAMMLIAINLGDEKINPENYDRLLTTIRTGLIIFAVLCVPAIFASLARNKKLNYRHKENPKLKNKDDE